MAIVGTAQGSIEGINVPLSAFCDEKQGSESESGMVEAYLGIPFAQPPVGPLRWKRPQGPAPVWKASGVRKSAWQRDPVQELQLSEFFNKPRRDVGVDEEGLTTISEDCLYLNVWIPKGERGQERDLPVLAWVYGGSFLFGGPSQPTYDGARLCNESGCIVVSIAYRVGLFGWLGSRQLAGEDGNGSKGTGNFGAWDVIAGLQWIQDSIGAFGGDASNVTIFGESAGSILIHYLLVSPETPRDLFARAVLQSGTACTVLPRTLPSAQATFDALVDQLGGSVTWPDADKLDVIRRASAEDVLAASMSLPSRRPRSEYRVEEAEGRPDRRMDHDQTKLTLEPQSLYGPVWDGVFVGPDFLNVVKDTGLPTRLRNGQKGIMLGYCADEGSVFNIAIMSPLALQHHAAGFHSVLLPQIKQLYGLDDVHEKEDSFTVCASYTGDALFQAPVRHLMLQVAQRTDLPSYGYLFAHRPSSRSRRAYTQSESAVGLLQKFGAMHTADLAFVFGVDGTEERVLQRESYPGKDWQARRNSQTGFTRAEQVLSVKWMSSLATFARQSPPWTALRPVTKVEDLNLLAVGRYAMLGSPTPAAVVAEDSGNEESDIPVREERLGENLTWTEKVGPAQGLEQLGSQADKQSFWTDDGFYHTLVNYYGDERIRFIP